MDRRHSRSLAATCAVMLGFAFAACTTPLSKGYEIHTGDVTCDEANRLVYAALRDMRMTVTEFTPAKPGQTGKLRAVRRDTSAGKLSGGVEIRCEADRVHIVADQHGDLLGDKEFERGVFLGVTGRGDLEVIREGRYATGEVRRRDHVLPPDSTSSRAAVESASAAARTAASSAVESALVVRVEALRGFASVLDFDADLSALGVLPVKVFIRNGTKRVYDFDPGTIVVANASARVSALTLDEAQQKLDSAVGVGEAAASTVGDVAAARKAMAEKSLAGGRIAPGIVREGFVYFPLGDYDRARMSMIDVATGEREGFVVDF